MTKEQMQAEYDKLLLMIGGATFSRLVYLTNEMNRALQKDAQCQKEKEKEPQSTK